MLLCPHTQLEDIVRCPQYGLEHMNRFSPGDGVSMRAYCPFCTTYSDKLSSETNIPLSGGDKPFHLDDEERNKWLLFRSTVWVYLSFYFSLLGCVHSLKQGRGFVSLEAKKKKTISERTRICRNHRIHCAQSPSRWSWVVTCWYISPLSEIFPGSLEFHVTFNLLPVCGVSFTTYYCYVSFKFTSDIAVSANQGLIFRLHLILHACSLRVFVVF